MCRIVCSNNIFPYGETYSHGFMMGEGWVVLHLTLSHKVKLKASGDLKKVAAFTALYLRQYLTNGFDFMDHNHKI